MIHSRLALSKEEITHWEKFDRAYAGLGHIYRAERIKPTRNPWLPGFVAE